MTEHARRICSDAYADGGSIPPASILSMRDKILWWRSEHTPVPGDFDGDGKSDVAVYNDTTGWWYMIYSSSGSLDYVKLGGMGYTPIQ